MPVQRTYRVVVKTWAIPFVKVRIDAPPVPMVDSKIFEISSPVATSVAAVRAKIKANCLLEDLLTTVIRQSFMRN